MGQSHCGRSCLAHKNDWVSEPVKVARNTKLTVGKNISRWGEGCSADMQSTILGVIKEFSIGIHTGGEDWSSTDYYLLTSDRNCAIRVVQFGNGEKIIDFIDSDYVLVVFCVNHLKTSRVRRPKRVLHVKEFRLIDC